MKNTLKMSLFMPPISPVKDAATGKNVKSATLTPLRTMKRGENLLYQDAVKQIKQHLYRGDEIVVISASIDNWVKPFAESLGINQVLGTQLELSGTGHLTGRFATANCYGEEKVKRLLQLYPDRTQYRLVVYGDSRGDKELLAFSDESYYKQFNR